MKGPDPQTDASTLRGKTFSLREHTENSDEYYSTIATLADSLLNEKWKIADLLSEIRKLGRSKRRLRGLVRHSDNNSREAILIRRLRAELSRYTPDVQSHLEGLSPLQRWDRILATSEEQYHVYMLEIELVNRLYGEDFRQSSIKLAFLPHCLRDLKADCQAAQRDVDYVCKGCTVGCNVNNASKLLRRHGVKPYIWMSANLRSLFKRLKREGNSVGVLGIACIPELVRGIRLCMRSGVPVVGVPLDANRCARWWGEFHWNMVNLEKLERLFTL